MLRLVEKGVYRIAALVAALCIVVDFSDSSGHIEFILSLPTRAYWSWSKWWWFSICVAALTERKQLRPKLNGERMKSYFSSFEMDLFTVLLHDLLAWNYCTTGAKPWQSCLFFVINYWNPGQPRQGHEAMMQHRAQLNNLEHYRRINEPVSIDWIHRHTQSKIVFERKSRNQ